jgi:GTP-binding protein EngB required for normal cell division
LIGKYRDDLVAVQRKVVQDYIARIRAQMSRVLEGQEIALPEPEISAIHSIRTTLAFVDVAVEELRPKYMRGYGKVPESVIPELNGIAGEFQGLVQKLNSYLGQGMAADLQKRLTRLDQTGNDIELLKAIERIVMEHGLVEFRSTLSMIVDRLEEGVFEIALFGRVSSGKSSLLNHILESNSLPVGVNPITAVPTRIAYGPAPIVKVWFPLKKAEQFPIDRLAEFATEQRNPSNSKHVSRILVELPSPRLASGVVFVDTPGLGSLATAGAAETLAYLPHCDLGVVLIDAGSTLTQDDLSTIRLLYDAGTPALALLSKADLLAAYDRERASAYISDQIRLHLGHDLSVRPVSATDEHASLLDQWFEDDILPLYEQHRQLARQSLRRKIGSLRESVEVALRARLKHSERDSIDKKCDPKEVEAGLRAAEGEFEEASRACVNFAREFSDLGDSVLARTADEVVESWSGELREGSQLATFVIATLTRLIAEKVKPLHETLTVQARQLARGLMSAAAALELNEVPQEDQLTAVIREMPRVELGDLYPELHLTALMFLNKGIARRWRAAKCARSWVQSFRMRYRHMKGFWKNGR